MSRQAPTGGPGTRAAAPWRAVLAVAGALGLGGAACTAVTDTLSLLPGTSDAAISTGAAGAGARDAGRRARGGVGASGGAAAGRDSGVCRTDAECARAASGPFCDRASGACVQCLDDTPCAPQHCEPTLHVCYGCTRNSDCRTPSTPYCDVDDRRCVQCLAQGQCPLGEACSAEGHRCLPACRTAADCVGSGRQYCAATVGVCNECLRNSDCPIEKPRCNAVTGSCVCSTDGDCPAGMRCEQGDHVCKN